MDGKANTTHTHNYLPLTGGTMTGPLYIQNIYPVTSGTGAIGMIGNPYNNIRSINFYPTDSTGTTVGYLSSTKNGTTSVNGECILSLGNNIVSGTNGNTRGFMRLYSNSQYYTQLCGPTSASSNKNVYLPDTEGTLALTSQLSNYLPLTAGSSKQITGQIVISNNSASTLYIRSSNTTAETDTGWYKDIIFDSSDGVRVAVIRSQVMGTSLNRQLTLGVSNKDNIAPSGISIIRNQENNYVYALAPRNEHPSTSQIRNIFAGTSSASISYNGDIYLKY